MRLPWSASKCADDSFFPLQDAKDAPQPISMHHAMRNSYSLGLLTTSASRLTLLTLQAQPDEALPDAAYQAQLAAAEAEAQQERCAISSWQPCALSLLQAAPSRGCSLQTVALVQHSDGMHGHCLTVTRASTIRVTAWATALQGKGRAGRGRAGRS